MTQPHHSSTHVFLLLDVPDAEAEEPEGREVDAALLRGEDVLARDHELLAHEGRKLRDGQEALHRVP